MNIDVKVDTSLPGGLIVNCELRVVFVIRNSQFVASYDAHSPHGTIPARFFLGSSCIRVGLV